MAGKAEKYIPPTHEEIAHHAYFLWLKEGGCPGRDLEHWLQAEAQLIATRKHDAGLLTAASSDKSKIFS